MLLVKTTIGPSAFHGLGLFADQLIPEGTVTWKYDADIDVSFTKQEVSALPPLAKEYVLHYSYYDLNRKLHIIPTDHLKFINHAKDKERRNIDSTPDMDTANRDILPGEELLCDYNQFDPTYFDRLGIHNLK